MNETPETKEFADWSRLPREPVVSVYMLAYGHERYLAQAIEGVLAQQCPFPIELIIGEDCSPDATRAIAIEYQRRHPGLIRVLTAERNVGALANAERCRQAARGRYIAICEGDDHWIAPSKLDRQVALMEQDPGLSLCCHASYKDDASRDDARVGTERPARTSRLLTTSEIIRGDGALIPTCSILARASLVRNLRPWRRSAPVGDYPLVLQAALEGRVAYIDAVMSVYRIHVPGSWSRMQTHDGQARHAHALKIARMLHGFLAEAGPGHARDVREVVSRYMFGAIVRHAGPRETRKSIYAAERRQLTPWDRLVAAASVLTDRNLGWMRTPGRRLSALLRRTLDDLRQPRIQIPGEDARNRWNGTRR